MEQPVEQGHRGGVLGQEAAQDSKGQWAGHPEAAMLIGGRHETEEQLAADIIERQV